jgi:hypothetical protein
VKQISILLGAGFSANMGYPIANRLNDKIINIHPEDFCVTTGGTVILKPRAEEDPYSYSDYASYKYFVTQLISLYNELSGNAFDYEKFYDFYNEIVNSESTNIEFDQLCEAFRNKFKVDTTNINLISQTNQIFNQLIAAFLVDGEGRRFYDPVHHCKPLYPGYTGFLNCLEAWGNDAIVHIHTLNHDLFFETFKDSDWIKSNLSDGFEELGSPYYGNMQNSNFKVRLPYFTNRYDTTYRLYKMHGSVDQFPFHIRESGIDSYIKIKFGISTNDLFKEVYDSGRPKYINDWINFHSDFLTGTTSKILRYREPWYYEKVFAHFEKNIQESDSLIVIGYGCGDTEINSLIKKNFNFRNNPLYMVDPCLSERTSEFLNRFNGKLIPKTPDNIETEEFN